MVHRPTDTPLLRAVALMLAAMLSACAPSADGIDPQGKTFDGITPAEMITLTGTEPFWAIQIEGNEATYSNPEHPEGFAFAVARFTGNNGLGLTGTLFAEPVTITLTPGQCSDGMSDRTFPYVATVALGEETLRGCGYTDKQPYTGDAAP
jgi:uncharacterized membrane protein